MTDIELERERIANFIKNEWPHVGFGLPVLAEMIKTGNLDKAGVNSKNVKIPLNQAPQISSGKVKLEVTGPKTLNVIIVNEHFNLDRDRSLIKALFSHTDDIVMRDRSVDMFDLLIELGVFSSKNNARKNWKQSGQAIPNGWSEFTNLGKNKHNLFIWNPTADVWD